MAYVNQTRASAHFGLRNRLSALVSVITERFAHYNTYRRTVAELNQLSARELADLGIHRSQIQSIARQAAYEA
ncbi:DUF1127 domain-containing protein [Frigidibacter sp. ROC022]|uniref:DUF1127 domain-containing protein n=1 Tax=Frigidibacter sp. ROC022 TaxID=2971796 RepID=UPI00215B1A69|nr:DUF1127 domain-containing protein [Frigidibacter sp. ROC022]MCR8725214.1 DUF1127 domain-containing protein [Frigidibacter sp. ROC022]